MQFKQKFFLVSHKKKLKKNKMTWIFPRKKKQPKPEERGVEKITKQDTDENL